ncbi:class I adenylate-forming enzyme family protein [Actinomadura violacea]|uniref:Acyl--CoA ligase n=1 Tax=Actinomadura violacea TaxID=2819934 RepID=A0ABS3RYJ4_9ACTN|nr:class I adenylate-forming enzyme family protein [Actinomadura violacea]MBO2461109.1 acyl--CoA ligase [Actinomadura violacea]
MSELLHHLLDQAADRDGEAAAVTQADTTLTYAGLRDAARRVAAGLSERGLRRGDRMVVTAMPDARLAALLYGAARIGVVFSVVHEQVRGYVLRHILGDCEPALLVADDPEAAETAAECGVAVAGLADAVPGPGAHGPVTEDEPLANDPACLIYTSGTTALPKAVVSTHAQMVFAARAIQDRLRYRADDTVYCPLPLSFDYGLYQLFLGAIAGSHVWLGSAAEAGPSLLANLLRSRATVLPAVPPVADGLLRMLRRGADRLPPLRLMTNTGAAMPRRVLDGLREVLPDLRVQLMFGLTECKRVSIMEPDEDLRRPGALGRPLAGTEAFTVDEHGRRLPPGETGELVVRGPHVMAGYWRRPELNEQRFPRREGLFPELRTGDYGMVDEDGYLHFRGRRDDVYKQQGFRVSAVEVEAAARRLPGVDGAAVLPPEGDRAEAVLFVTGGAEPAEVQRRLRDDLETFKVPQRCHAVAELPVNANGKTDKKALRARLEEGVHA